jgi:hypothetical protein
MMLLLAVGPAGDQSAGDGSLYGQRPGRRAPAWGLSRPRRGAPGGHQLARAQCRKPIALRRVSGRGAWPSTTQRNERGPAAGWAQPGDSFGLCATVQRVI